MTQQTDDRKAYYADRSDEEVLKDLKEKIYARMNGQDGKLYGGPEDFERFANLLVDVLVQSTAEVAMLRRAIRDNVPLEDIELFLHEVHFLAISALIKNDETPGKSRLDEMGEAIAGWEEVGQAIADKYFDNDISQLAQLLAADARLVHLNDPESVTRVLSEIPEGVHA